MADGTDFVRTGPEGRPTLDTAPSLSALRVVDAACRHGNFRKAGRELGISHSAISQQLARLEKLLGAPLFVRDGATARPTAVAEELADGYRRAVVTLERSLRRARAGERGRGLIVSLPSSLANPWMRHRLGLLGEALADTRVEVRDDAAEPDFGRVDVAVVSGARATGGLWVEPLFDRWVAPVCSPAFQKTHQLDELEGLHQAPLLVHDEEAWERWFTAAGLKRRPRPGTLLDPAMAIGAAMDGYGVAMACRVSASTELEQGRLVRPFALWAETSTRFQLAWPEDHPDLPAIHAFADWMKAQVSLSATEMDAVAA